MKMIVKPQPEGLGLTLEEAFELYGGKLYVDKLSPEKCACVEFAEKEQECQTFEIVLYENAQYHLGTKSPVMLDRPFALSGNGAVITGCGQDGFYITSGRVSFTDVTFKGFCVNMEIDGQDKVIRDIIIERVKFKEFCGAPIQTGTTHSNGGISGLTIRSCLFENNDVGEHGNVTSGYSSIALNCANAKRFGSIENVLLEDVKILNCTFCGISRETINVLGGVCGNMFDQETRECRDICIRNLSICGNHFSGSYDATINVIAGFQNNFGAKLEGLEIGSNTIEFGLWGIFVIAGEPIFHTVGDVQLKQVNIHDNRLVMKEGGCGEPSCGIAVNGGRIDFYSASVTDCLTQDVHITGNQIESTDRGIMIIGGHALLDADAPSEVSRCKVKDIVIENNRMKDVETCFLFYGAYFEGRRYDWKIGVPGADIQWQNPVEDNSLTTCIGNGNEIIELVCKDNVIEGYHSMIQAFGAFARGHGLMKNNKIKKAVFKENHFEKGGMHLHMADCLMQDFAKDGGGNTLELHTPGI